MVGTLGCYATLYCVCRGDVALGTQWNSGMGLAGMVMGLMGVPFAAGGSARGQAQCHPRHAHAGRWRLRR